MGDDGMNAAGMSNAEWRRDVGMDKDLKDHRGSQVARLQQLVDQKRRFVGIIRHFNKERGFGFIACEEANQITGNDVFLHNENREGFDVGDVVSFAIDIRNGQAQAKALRPSAGKHDRGERPYEDDQPRDYERDLLAARYPARTTYRDKSRNRSRSDDRGGRRRSRSRR